MKKAVSIALLWVATFAVLAIVYFTFVQPYAHLKDPGFVVWSLGLPLGYGIIIIAIAATKKIYSKKQPR